AVELAGGAVWAERERLGRLVWIVFHPVEGRSPTRGLFLARSAAPEADQCSGFLRRLPIGPAQSGGGQGIEFATCPFPPCHRSAGKGQGSSYALRRSYPFVAEGREESCPR